MRRPYQILVVGLLALMCVACGKTITTNGVGSSTDQGGQTPVSTAQPSGATTQDGVSITLDNAGFQATGAVNVTIHNGSNQTIMATDHHSYCTMVTVQQQINGVWTALAPCKLMIATRAIEIATQTTMTQKVSATTSGWAKGTYRITFGFITPGAATQNTISTSNFTVN